MSTTFHLCFSSWRSQTLPSSTYVNEIKITQIAKGRKEGKKVNNTETLQETKETTQPTQLILNNATQPLRTNSQFTKQWSISILKEKFADPKVSESLEFILGRNIVARQLSVVQSDQIHDINIITDSVNLKKNTNFQIFSNQKTQKTFHHLIN